MKKSVLFLLALLLLSFPGPAFAQAPPPSSEDLQFGDFEIAIPGITETSIDNFVKGDNPLTRYVSVIINIMTGLVIAIAVIMVVAGGFMMLTAGGDAGKVGKGKSIILSALVAILLALVAWVILNTIAPQFASELKDPCFGTDCP